MGTEQITDQPQVRVVNRNLVRYGQVGRLTKVVRPPTQNWIRFSDGTEHSFSDKDFEGTETETEGLVWTSRTVVQKGIELLWEQRKAYEPDKGKVVRTGRVFITEETLWELSKQGQWDSQFGGSYLLAMDQGLALEQAGLAVRETKGGYHSTEKLREFLGCDD